MKRKCVLGVLDTPAGLNIAAGMRTWLDEKYDVEEVHVAPPNDVLYEYPFIKRAVEVSMETGEPVLYLHTKGAAMYNTAQAKVRDMWHFYFGVKSDEMFQLVEGDTPVCAAPYVSSKCCWYNGFVLNQSAARAIQSVLAQHPENRYWFECGDFREECLMSAARVEIRGFRRYEDSNVMTAMLNRDYKSILCSLYPDRTRAIVSMTTWKARVDTAWKTIDNVWDVSKPLKVVLALGRDEFEDESKLPRGLLDLSVQGKVEFLWTEIPDATCFKKVLLAQQAYPDFPVVSADDDCLYREDYVGRLFHAWQSRQGCMWTYRADYNTGAFAFGKGPCCLYPPMCFGRLGVMLGFTRPVLDTRHDDVFYGVLAKILGIPVREVSKELPYDKHDEVSPLSEGKEMLGRDAINTVLTVFMKYVTGAKHL